MVEKKFNVLPGFGLTLGYTLAYLSVIVIIPIACLFLHVLLIGNCFLTWRGKRYRPETRFISLDSVSLSARLCLHSFH